MTGLTAVAEGGDTFRRIYEVGTAMFLVQGLLLPVVLLVFGIVWLRHIRAMAPLHQALKASGGAPTDLSLAAVLKAIPNLKPLTCVNCRAPVALQRKGATCTACGMTAVVAEEYRAVEPLHRRLAALTRRAIRHWRLARLFITPPVRTVLFLMIFAEPALFVLVIVGANTYADTALDRAMEAIGEGWAMVVMIAAFGGMLLWLVMFVMLRGLSSDLRRALPPFRPVDRRVPEATAFGVCRSCGGGIHYEGSNLACLCYYCHEDNFRTDFMPERDPGEAGRTLFAAMQVIEAFVGTLFIGMSILVLGFVIFVLTSGS